MWPDIAARGWELVTLGVLLLAGVAIWTQDRPGEYSCAPADPDDDEGAGADDDRWDRARDRWIDEQEGAA